jgi:hypothetical protein
MLEQDRYMNGAPCSRCTAQARRGAADGPHVKLQRMCVCPVKGPTGQWQEAVYRCEECGSVLLHSSSRIQNRPHWSII